MAASREYVGGSSGAACVWRVSVTMTSRASTCDGRDTEVVEREGDDLARQALAVAGDGVGGARASARP